MTNVLTTTIDRFKGFWGRTNLTQRVFLAGLAVAVVAAFAIMLAVMNQPSMKVLYSQLAPEDASRIVEILKADKVKYELSDNGATISVPESMVYDLRLRIAVSDERTPAEVEADIRRAGYEVVWKDWDKIFD